MCCIINTPISRILALLSFSLPEAMSMVVILKKAIKDESGWEFRIKLQT